MQKPPTSIKAFVVGTTGWQHTVVIADKDAGLPDAKPHADFYYEDVGGVGFNTALAMQQMATRNKQHLTVTLGTALGPDTKKNYYKNIVMDWVEGNGFQTGIKFCDFKQNDPNYKTSLFLPFIKPDGRTVYMPKKELEFHFNSAASKQEEIDLPKFEKVSTIRDEIAPCKVVVLCSRFLEESLMASHFARLKNIPIVLDLNMESPEFTTNPKYLDMLIKRATHIVVPAETVLPGMREPSADVLIDILKNTYNKTNFAISDGGEPIYIMSEGEASTYAPKMPPRFEAYNNMWFATGAGDTRTGGVAYMIANDASMRDAVIAGTDLASYYIGFYGASAFEHMGDEYENWKSGQEDGQKNDQKNDQKNGLTFDL